MCFLLAPLNKVVRLPVAHLLVTHLLVAHLLVTHLLVTHLLVTHLLVTHLLVTHLLVTHLLVAWSKCLLIPIFQYKESQCQKHCTEGNRQVNTTDTGKIA